MPAEHRHGARHSAAHGARASEGTTLAPGRLGREGHGVRGPRAAAGGCAPRPSRRDLCHPALHGPLARTRAAMRPGCGGVEGGTGARVQGKAEGLGESVAAFYGELTDTGGRHAREKTDGSGGSNGGGDRASWATGGASWGAGGAGGAGGVGSVGRSGAARVHAGVGASRRALATAPEARMPPAGGAALAASNRGFKMLAAMGWQSGKGLGKAEQGPTEAPGAVVKGDRAGLGASAKDDRLVGDESSAAEKAKREQARKRMQRRNARQADADAELAATGGIVAKEARRLAERRRQREEAVSKALYREFRDGVSVADMLSGKAPPPPPPRAGPARPNPLAFHDV